MGGGEGTKLYIWIHFNNDAIVSQSLGKSCRLSTYPLLPTLLTFHFMAHALHAQSLWIDLGHGETGVHKYQNPKSCGLKISTLYACYTTIEQIKKTPNIKKQAKILCWSNNTPL